jgi:hypothetical protein
VRIRKGRERGKKEKDLIKDMHMLKEKEAWNIDI